MRALVVLVAALGLAACGGSAEGGGPTASAVTRPVDRARLSEAEQGRLFDACIAAAANKAGCPVLVDSLVQCEYRTAASILVVATDALRTGEQRRAEVLELAEDC